MKAFIRNNSANSGRIDINERLDDTMQVNDEIVGIQDIILNTVPALQIYLFGSHASETQREDSDYDFYVVIPDNSIRPLDAARRISMALRPVRKTN